MSTKIYNGYRIKGGLELTYMRLLGVRKGFQDIADDQTRSFLCTNAALRYDTFQLNGKHPLVTTTGLMSLPNPLQAAWGVVNEYFDRAAKGHNSPYDFDSELVLFPHGDYTLMIAYIVSPEQRDLLRSLHWGDTCSIEEYAYWDNTDPPDHVNDLQWRTRKLHWEAALGKTMIPAVNGLTKQLSRNSHVRAHVTIDSLESFIPSAHRRAENLTSNMGLGLDERLEAQMEIEKMLEPLTLDLLRTDMF